MTLSLYLHHLFYPSVKNLVLLQTKGQKCRYTKKVVIWWSLHMFNLQSMPITSSKSDQIFQMVSRKESTPWTNRSVVLEKNWKPKRSREKLRLCKIWSLVYREIDCSNTRKTNNEQEMLLMSVLIQFRAPQNMNISWFKFNTYIVKNNTTAFIISDPVWMQPVKQTKTRGFYMNRENPLRRTRRGVKSFIYILLQFALAAKSRKCHYNSKCRKCSWTSSSC